MAILRITRRGEQADGLPQGEPCSGMAEPSGLSVVFRLEGDAR